ncbi:MAG: FMN-binding negative transcriptional regulator [Oligoflexia bacterium]|nr:FMN-binding negative transcriptional regulator [Oligoflexia bacterium]
MYLPAQFHERDTEALLKIIRAYPFATVVTQGKDGPFVSHLPVIVEVRGQGEVVLLGHMAKGNPQWRHERDALVVFHGPHAYITPRWYKDPMNVPTWNYAVVHASGKAVPIESREGIERILRLSVEQFERSELKSWQYDLPEAFKAELAQAMVGFEITVSHLEGKFKMSQNRSPEDRAGILAGLGTRKDEMSQKTLELMLSSGCSSRELR